MTAMQAQMVLFQGLSVQAMALPLMAYLVPEVADPGTLLEFPQGSESHDMAVPVPFLPGMDEVEVGEAAAAIGSRPVERVTDHAGPTGSGTEATLTLTPPVADAPVSLKRIEIEGFSAGTDGVARTLSAPGLTVSWAAGSAASVAGPLAGAEALHLLASPTQGPPFLAAPAFPMPGAGAQLYGDALGGCALAATRNASGQVRLVLTPGAAPLAALRLTVVRLAADAPRLPNEGRPVPWRAQSIRAVWALHPAALKVEAAAAGRAVTVAELPGGPSRMRVDFDFAAALRGLARPAYDAAAGGPDLGLALRVTATGPGAARLLLNHVGLRYLRRPLARPERLSLRGAAAGPMLPGAPGLHPAALDLAVDGRFLPDRLTDASDDTPAQPRQGLVAEASLRLARRTTLTDAERALPIARMAIFGRAAAATELLLSLHEGDQLRVGARIGAPVALTLSPASVPAWHLALFPTPLPPPLPPILWLVAEAPRGRFLWHGAAPDDDTALLSGDGGGSWAAAAHRPALQLAVREPVPAPSPLALHWAAGGAGGPLADDASGGTVEFRRRLVLTGDAFANVLAATAAAPLALRFASRRDVDLAVSEATFVYNPWTARP